ncbi:MAG: orotidine-5'-phosphate decarboxylase [Bacteroidia bacterium]|nr:orotidine-5'-phosphate decarboxylase [Bacteroidia bacterium]
MSPAALSAEIFRLRSFLCVGLDPDPARLPAAVRGEADPILAFNQAIIQATAPFAVAYKPNLAFYEALGAAGWETLRATVAAIPPGKLIIADAKRGDIGNTSRMYAQACFGALGADAVTVAPYMGQDSVVPFLEFPGKWVFLLALTSNPGAADFQYAGGPAQPLYQEVLRRAQEWAEGKPGELGFVAGATRAEALRDVRRIAPESWLLVPGVGEQGGDLDAVCQTARTAAGGLLINASRSILYAGGGSDFAARAAEAAEALQRRMALHIG